MRPVIGCTLIAAGAFMLPVAGLLVPAILLIAGGMRMVFTQEQRDSASGFYKKPNKKYQP